MGRSVLLLRLPWSPARNAISASALAWASGPLQPQLARDAFLNNSPAHPQLLARNFPSQASRPIRRERRKRFPPGDCNPKRSTAVFGTFRNPLTPALPGPARSGSGSEVRACLLQVGVEVRVRVGNRVRAPGLPPEGSLEKEGRGPVFRRPRVTSAAPARRLGNLEGETEARQERRAQGPDLRTPRR